MEWWNLPGPSSFVNEIAIDIANGCNVIVWLPMHTPDGFRDELRERLSRDIKWESLYLEDMGKNEPLDYLYKEFVHGELPRQSQRSLADLMSLEAFGGNVFWMHGLDSHNWKGWIQFLEIYKQACRNIDHLHRSVFCFEWEGQLLGELPDEDVCLRIRKFDNILNSLDIQLFVKTNLPYEKNNGILRNLKSEIVTVLAQWDAFLAEKLMFMNIENLLNILGFLKEFARELDWGNRNDMNDDIAWTYGVCQRLEEKQIMHSCWCALNNPFEIQRRIWQAQLRVLYPFLEEQRLAILQQINPGHIMPFKDRYGKRINDLKDIEIGQLEFLIRKKALNKYSHLLERVGYLKDIRNRLAHRKIVDFKLLQSEAILDPLHL